MSEVNQTSSTLIQSLYKSRGTILAQMNFAGYVAKDYLGFSINEIDAMYINSRLDMLLSHEKNGTKVYIKYYFSPRITSKQIRPQMLDNIIEDLFDIENVLTKKDTLVIITGDEPNETLLNKMKYLYDKDGIFVVIHNINRLQYNILEHTLVPAISILNDDEVTDMLKKYNLKSIHHLPEISRYDPQALAVLMRPGQVAMFNRNSVTAINTLYYRVCI